MKTLSKSQECATAALALAIALLGARPAHAHSAAGNPSPAAEAAQAAAAPAEDMRSRVKFAGTLADRGVQQLQVEPGQCHPQTDRRGDVDDELRRRPGAGGQRRARRPERLVRVLDTNGSIAATPALTLGFDLTHTRNQLRSGDPSRSLFGVGVYGRDQTTAASALAVRYGTWRTTACAAASTRRCRRSR